MLFKPTTMLPLFFPRVFETGSHVVDDLLTAPLTLSNQAEGSFEQHGFVQHGFEQRGFEQKV